MILEQAHAVEAEEVRPDRGEAGIAVPAGAPAPPPGRVRCRRGPTMPLPRGEAMGRPAAGARRARAAASARAARRCPPLRRAHTPPRVAAPALFASRQLYSYLGVDPRRGLGAYDVQKVGFGQGGTRGGRGTRAAIGKAAGVGRRVWGGGGLMAGPAALQQQRAVPAPCLSQPLAPGRV
jgi:hypothetical protein